MEGAGMVKPAVRNVLLVSCRFITRASDVSCDRQNRATIFGASETSRQLILAKQCHRLQWHGKIN
jgi:hypothetical protein